MDFGQLFAALEKNTLVAMLALAVLAIGWLVKTMLKMSKDHTDEIKELHKEHLATAMTVIPLTQQVVRCVEVLERKA